MSAFERGIEDKAQASWKNKFKDDQTLSPFTYIQAYIDGYLQSIEDRKAFIANKKGTVTNRMK